MNNSLFMKLESVKSEKKMLIKIRRIVIAVCFALFSHSVSYSVSSHTKNKEYFNKNLMFVIPIYSIPLCVGI